MQDLFNPAFSPDGRLVAVVRAPGPAIGAGPIALYDTATATLVRTLTAGRDSQPTWSPDGQRIAFARGDEIYVLASPRRRRRDESAAYPKASSPFGSQRRVASPGNAPR